jgi:hypothetical protein
MIPHMFARRCLFLVFLAGALFAAGCQRTPKLDLKVTAGTARDFSSWQTQNRGEFTPAEWSEFEAVQQDIKLRIIALKEATGTDAVNEALRAKIHGKTFREVMRLGYDDRLWRLNVERTEFQKMVAGNSTLRTAEGDIASANELRRKIDLQKNQLKKAEDEIKATEAKRDALAAPGNQQVESR